MFTHFEPSDSACKECAVFSSLSRSLASIAFLLASLPVQASFHLWQLSEVFSNADGSVQFVELTAFAGGQQFLAGQSITASSGLTTRPFVFPTNLPGDSAGKKFLVGTAGFAALGVVAPDYVVPDGFLFLSGGTVNFAGFDIWNYGSMPTDGSLSLNRDGSTATNSPTNFAGVTGQVIPIAHILSVSRAGAGTGTVSSVPSGIDCGATCSASFNAGASVALTATPGPGSVFGGWSGACAGTGACNVTMNAANSVTATFSLVPSANPARLGNISTRMQTLTGDDVMIGGFIIQGDAPQTVVVRARGPSLIPFGITNALANPVLQLFSGQTLIASNDDWQSATNAAAITSSGFAPSSNLESAILITLNAGAYTAIVTGAGGGTGVGIVEVFAQ